ncbi:jacalin-related lectin 3 isoform X2 [Curcuma longa]|uniref:jacalin-related lectin 3 isoform X2 n=1 Tax=Curcuma longa TaxID=136217 RepID=UPI003D9F2EE1
MSLSSEKKRPIVVGPWGGPGGSRWDDGVYTGIKQVVVVHGAGIVSVQFEYDQKGCSVWSEKHGGDGGTRIDKITLNYPVEYLTSVCGYYGSLSSGSAIIIKSLRFESNLSKYGPFGFEQGMYFSFPMSSGKIVGFHGRAGWYLDSIGFYLQKLGSPDQSKALVSSQSQELSITEKSGYSIVDGIDGTSSNTYDIFLALRGRGDNFAILSNNYTRGATLPAPEYRSILNSGNSKMISLPSYTSERGYSMPGPLTYGPWGGSGGTIFDDGVYTGIREIKLTRNIGITSIKVLYDRNGQAVWGNKNGGSGGIKTDKIVFDFPFEILTHVTGYFGTTMIMGPTAVKSLKFHTTKRDYGPYGDEEGAFFSSLLVDGKVVGFHGRSGWFVDSIGVHVLEGKVASTLRNKVAMPLLDYSRWPSNQIDSSKGIEEEVVYGMIKEPASTDPGPWGGNGGRPWDDGVYSGIKQVYITRGDVINSIQIEYDRSGQSVWSVRHGSSGEISHRVKFDYPNEVLNCLSGYYCTNSYDDSIKVVKSLTFHSTRGKYGPFGEEVGTYFTSNLTQGKVVGFHGRSGLYLDAIGVHMQHWLGEKKPAASKSMFSKYFF